MTSTLTAVHLSLISFFIFLNTLAPSGPPTNVTVGYVSPSLEIQWEPPEFFERNGFIDGYEVTLTYSDKVDRAYNLSGSTLGVIIDCNKNVDY